MVDDRYPTCLHVLTLLRQREFRDAIMRADIAKRLGDEIFEHFTKTTNAAEVNGDTSVAWACCSHRANVGVNGYLRCHVGPTSCKETNLVQLPSLLIYTRKSLQEKVPPRTLLCRQSSKFYALNPRAQSPSTPRRTLLGTSPISMSSM
jgi:hypothetical protein